VELWYVSVIGWLCLNFCTDSSHCLHIQTIHTLFLPPHHVVFINDIPLCLYKILVIVVLGECYYLGNYVLKYFKVINMRPCSINPVQRGCKNKSEEEFMNN
jgi:hypothetical protein